MRDLETSEVIGQIRSLASDLLPAAKFHACSTNWTDFETPHRDVETPHADLVAAVGMREAR